MTSPTHALKTFSAPILKRAALDSFVKLDPRVQWKNPVMFVVLAGSVLVTLQAAASPSAFAVQIALWL